MNSQSMHFSDSESGTLTVAQVISEYLTDKMSQVRRGAYKPRSLEKKRLYLNSFALLFGNVQVSRARRNDLRRWLNLHPEWKAAATIHDACSAIISCFRWAAGDGDLIDQCVFVRPKLPAIPPAQRLAITFEEYQRIMHLARSCNGRRRRARPSRFAFRLSCLFLWETGARTCEMREVLWEWLDWKAGVIRLPDHKTSGVTGLDRLIPLTKKLLRVLALVYRFSKKAGPIFRSGRRRPWTRHSFSRMFTAYAKLAGVRPGVTAYCIRHGFTVRGLEAGIGDRQLADVLGHTTTRYVAHYGKTARTKAEYLRGTLEKMARSI